MVTTVRPCPKLSATQKRVYNLSQNEFELLWESNDGCCHVCDKPFTPSPKRRACIDHSHENGRTRGLLCPPCNLAFGYRTPEWFARAAAYLKYPPAYATGIWAIHRNWNEDK